LSLPRMLAQNFLRLALASFEKQPGASSFIWV
jgi:hypothetical protein